MMRRAVLAVLLLASVAGCNSKEKHQIQASAGGGDADRGKQLIQKYGCDSCHAIPGVKGAQGMVGPTLQHIASRQIIASRYPNNPQTMIRWIQNPQALDPQSSMPNMAVTPADARDITAYLFTLK
jgi:cytochrome c